MKLIINNTKDYVYKRPGIVSSFCLRCHSINVTSDTCTDCGIKKEDIIYFQNRVVEKKYHTMTLSFPLSEKQKEASTFFLNHLIKRKNAFLYAVCGSGKTEIMYESILYALNHQLKVAIVIPRKEIIKELYYRLKNVFVNTTIKYLDAKHHDDRCDLILSTCNQMINYEKEFDFIILDEADAFPYSNSEYLKRIVKKALKKNGVFFRMSATKNEKIKDDTFILNRRYHKADLVYPKYYKVKGDYLNNKDFKKILNKNRKFIIFTDSIEKASFYSNKLNTQFVSSKNINSREIIEKFKEGKEKILISTTLLERGITINNLDVIILDADSKIFNYQTIIQICGRVGRSYNDKYGSVYIFSHRNHLKYYLVNRYIRRMNEM